MKQLRTKVDRIRESDDASRQSGKRRSSTNRWQERQAKWQLQERGKLRREGWQGVALVATVWLLASIGAAGQAVSLPDAPQPHLGKLDRALVAADGASRFADILTTHRLLNDQCRCGYEMDPIAPGGHGWGHMTMFQLGMFVAVQVGSRELRLHHHAKLARWLVVADIADETVAVVGNVRAINGAAGRLPNGTTLPAVGQPQPIGKVQR